MSHDAEFYLGLHCLSKWPFRGLQSSKGNSWLFFFYNRVVAKTGKITDVSGQKFLNFGAHCDDYPCNYLTAAAAIGMTKKDIDLFISRLDQVLKKSKLYGGKTHLDSEEMTGCNATSTTDDTVLIACENIEIVNLDSFQEKQELVSNDTNTVSERAMDNFADKGPSVNKDHDENT